MKDMLANQRFRSFLKGDEVDRFPMIEWAPWWNKTLLRWNKEGLNIVYDFSKIKLLQIQRQFGLDGCVQTIFKNRSSETPVPNSFGAGIMWNEQYYHNLKNSLFKEPSTLYDKNYYDWLKTTQQVDRDTINFFTLEVFFGCRENYLV